MCFSPFLKTWFNFNGKKLNQVFKNGEKHIFLIQTVKGMEYAWITVKPGFNYIIEISYK